MSERLILDHIGYAVADIARYLEQFVVPILRPCAVGSIIHDPMQRVRVAFVTLEGGTRIELIQPTDLTSPICKILQDRRGGLYHVCYQTQDLRSAIARFRDRGSLLVSDPVPAVAFDGRQIAFLFTPHRDIIELVEAKSSMGGE